MDTSLPRPRHLACTLFRYSSTLTEYHSSRASVGLHPFLSTRGFTPDPLGVFFLLSPTGAPVPAAARAGAFVPPLSPMSASSSHLSILRGSSIAAPHLLFASSLSSSLLPSLWLTSLAGDSHLGTLFSSFPLSLRFMRPSFFSRMFRSLLICQLTKLHVTQKESVVWRVGGSTPVRAPPFSLGHQCHLVQLH